eukprot:7516463-Pyramimonas_sp.AAC.1
MSEHKRLVRLIARAFYSGECPPKMAANPGGGRSRMDKVPMLVGRRVKYRAKKPAPCFNIIVPLGELQAIWIRLLTGSLKLRFAIASRF